MSRWSGSLAPLVATPLVLVAAIASGGCKGREVVLASSDVRIDGAGEEDDGIDSEQARTCVTKDEQVFTVWVDDRDGASAVWLNRSLDGGLTWATEPIRVNRGDGDATSPDIDCGSDGVFVVWEDRRDGDLDNTNIYYNRSFDFGDTWLDADVRLDDDEDGKTMSLGPRIVVADRVYVTWFDNVKGAFDIYVAVSPNGSQFRPATRVDGGEAGSAYSAWPRVGADGNGAVYVVWEDSRNGEADIYFAGSYDKGESFQPEVRLDLGDIPGAYNSFSPRLASDDERVYVVWHDERGGDGRDILFNWSPNRGLSWSTIALRVDTDNAGAADSIYPDIFLADGLAHFTWQDNRHGGYDIFYRQAADGDFDEPELRVDSDAPGHGNSLHPRVIARGQNILVAWEDRRDDDGTGYNDIYYNWSEDGGLGWQYDRRIDSLEAAASFKVDLDVDLRGGDIYASWTDGRRGNSDVFFHRLPLGEQAQYIEVEP